MHCLVNMTTLWKRGPPPPWKFPGQRCARELLIKDERHRLNINCEYIVHCPWHPEPARENCIVTECKEKDPGNDVYILDHRRGIFVCPDIPLECNRKRPDRHRAEFNAFQKGHNVVLSEHKKTSTLRVGKHRVLSVWPGTRGGKKVGITSRTVKYLHDFSQAKTSAANSG